MPEQLPPLEWVTLVVEVARTQRLADVQTKANRWLIETSVREVILLKVSKHGNRLRAQLYRQGAANPVQNLVFHGNHCTALGQQLLHISLASVFPGGVPAVLTAAHPRGTIDIDLFPVKQAILEALQ
eukprot:TRINITY_DN1523_c0_g1_i2.p1 TRINITY_DN1523_c0_g1~~TRINITY_DN1523_c0_g1_i2.p1  ORF type:complete len:127 (+),score=18.79 TRINITY_DN1523_c0_g1_i2:591-971(+)